MIAERLSDLSIMAIGMDADERAIRNLIETWLAASKAGDTTTVLNLMTEDVVFMTSGAKPFGKEAFRAASEGMKNLRLDAKSEIHEIKVLGEWAFLRSYLEIIITAPGNTTPVRRSGFTLTIVRKEADGQWRLSRDANMLSVEKPAS